MKIRKLDHFTLRTDRLDETAAFFKDVAGLKPGPRPTFGFAGVWLYADEVAVVHLAVYDPSDKQLSQYLGDRSRPGGGGTVDHIAFRCDGLPSFERLLKELSQHYAGRTVPAIGEHQVFVTDPNGLHIEFIFSSSEEASWTLPSMTTETATSTPKSADSSSQPITKDSRNI